MTYLCLGEDGRGQLDHVGLSLHGIGVCLLDQRPGLVVERCHCADESESLPVGEQLRVAAESCKCPSAGSIERPERCECLQIGDCPSVIYILVCDCLTVVLCCNFKNYSRQSFLTHATSRSNPAIPLAEHAAPLHHSTTPCEDIHELAPAP